jgi:uncharacterized protein YbbC (DUF1343 family)
MKLTMLRFLPLIFASVNLSYASGQAVTTGIENLVSSNFQQLKGKRVGLITNPTAIDRNFKSTTDILFGEKSIKLVALYGPEHGVRGDFAAGEKVTGVIDPLTSLPVHSLYGSTRKPTTEMLKDIDILVYDIQDIGSRSYTYISTLGLAMEAAAENNIPFIVLDRPNPLGGKKREGMLTEETFTSFVSQYPVPYLHGLTVGELALLLNGEWLLKNGVRCKLEVIRMSGWKRRMTFNDTGLPWVPTSPHIPYAETAFYYPATGILGELYTMSIGVGYTMPFMTVASEWADADSLASALEQLSLQGVKFRPIHYKPYYSVSAGKPVHGVQIHLTDPIAAPLGLIQFYILQEAHRLWPGKNVFELCEKSRLSMFDKVCGSDKIRILFSKKFMVEDIKELWYGDIEKFNRTASKYLLYK